MAVVCASCSAINFPSGTAAGPCRQCGHDLDAAAAPTATALNLAPTPAAAATRAATAKRPNWLTAALGGLAVLGGLGMAYAATAGPKPPGWKTATVKFAVTKSTVLASRVVSSGWTGELRENLVQNEVAGTYKVSGKAYPYQSNIVERTEQRDLTVYYDPKDPANYAKNKPLDINGEAVAAAALALGGMALAALSFGVGGDQLMRRAESA